MRSTFKLTFAALAVSLLLSGCKSSQGPSVVAKNAENQAVALNQAAANSSTTANTENSNRRRANTARISPVPTVSNETVTSTSSGAEGGASTDGTENQAQLSESGNLISQLKPVNTDSAGQHWRMISLSRQGQLADSSRYRQEHRESFSISDDSPFESTEFGNKSYNHLLTLDLGTHDKSQLYIQNINQGEYLGKHRGTLTDTKIKGDDHNIHYIYVNQPYSSYGALFTDGGDHELFHVQLSTGREGARASSDGNSAPNYAEYGVYTLNGKTARWNEGLIGDSVYQGEVIARVEKMVDGEVVAFSPEFDGKVTLNLNLSNDWEKSKISGQIDSRTLGTIQLNESTLPKPEFLSNRIGFYGEAEVEKSADLQGFYSVELAGEKLHDAVGSIELDNEAEDFAENDVVKYDAVFGATKNSQ